MSSILVDLGSGMSAQTLRHNRSYALRVFGTGAADGYVDAVQGVHEGLRLRREWD
jgi:hypothetical protein